MKMEAAPLNAWPRKRAAPTESYCNGNNKRLKPSPKVADYSSTSQFRYLFDEGDRSKKFGSVTKEIEELILRNQHTISSFLLKYPVLFPASRDDRSRGDSEGASGADQHNASELEERRVANKALAISAPIVIIDSDDDEDDRDRVLAPLPVMVNYQGPFPNPLQENYQGLNPCFFQEIVLPRPAGQLVKDIVVRDHGDKKSREVVTVPGGIDSLNKDKGAYVGVEEDDSLTKTVDDGLGDVWKQMSFALEFEKVAVECPSSDDHSEEDDEYCDHSFLLKDDIGYVCRICGVVDRRIETIIDIQFSKGKRSTRTYISESRSTKDRDSNGTVGVELPEENLMATDITAHPRHMKQMKPHQVEGFNFLCSNLVADNPGGCILAHAPGSGKTFMIISFMQSFLAKYPQARPLVVLPKGILPTWKKEFQRWQVEDIPLYDFYSVKADSRLQQLEVLKQWMEQRSILFLGYKQFATIVCEDGNNNVSASCQEILLKRPSIMILDEGHTPRNENTDVLQSLAKVQTPRKVVLSGTLYQNHVKEVFNILNLVRPKFLRLDTSRAIVKRIMSKVNVPLDRKQVKAGADAAFYDLVEYTLQKSHDFRRKVSVIQDLREMTRKVLHYYKGDFLDELPGLLDFTVILNLKSKQKREVQELKKFARKFKRSSVGSAVYLHPKLKPFSENSATDAAMDELLENLDVKDGVKAKFFLSMLNLCDSSGEKLLVFSQYLTPLKFLERLVVKVKGWMPGREMFMISGESTSEQREFAMERFNNSMDAKVFFGSIKACGEGISLVGASRIIILDVHINPSVTRQAIGRAFRPGQKNKVYAYRLVAADSPEEEDHSTCFRKEAISKMWFEWNEYCGYQDFEMETVELKDCGDQFFESKLVQEDVRVLYKR